MVYQGEKVWPLGIIFTVRKSIPLGWLFFLDKYDGHCNCWKYFRKYPGYAVCLWWKMINMGTQGVVKLEDQVCALHIYVNKLDAMMGQTVVYGLVWKLAKCQPHVYTAWLNVAGSVDGLGAQQQRMGKCQQVMCLPEHMDRNWCIKTWEIELLDSQSGLLGMSLLDALMPIPQTLLTLSLYSFTCWINCGKRLPTFWWSKISRVIYPHHDFSFTLIPTMEVCKRERRPGCTIDCQVAQTHGLSTGIWCLFLGPSQWVQKIPIRWPPQTWQLFALKGESWLFLIRHFGPMPASDFSGKR